MPRSSDTHVIRLREPWEREVVCSGAEVPNSERVRFRRRFGLPTGLEPKDQIDLVIDRVAANGNVWLNDDLLGAIVAGELPARFCLRGRLQTRNLLMIEFASPDSVDGSQLPTTEQQPSFGGCAGEVRLEIRSS